MSPEPEHADSAITGGRLSLAAGNPTPTDSADRDLTHAVIVEIARAALDPKRHVSAEVRAAANSMNVNDEESRAQCVALLRLYSATPGPAVLRVVPDPVPQPTATPCPPWCAIDHDDPMFDDDRSFHYSETVWTGPINQYMNIDEDGAHTIALGLGRDPEYLDLDEVDALIASLTAQRATLAAFIAVDGPA